MVKAGFDIESLAGERIWIGMVGVFGRHVPVDQVLAIAGGIAQGRHPGTPGPGPSEQWQYNAEPNRVLCPVWKGI